MKMVRDNTGRFGVRPHYTQMELDHEFEVLTLSFLRRHHGKERFPIATDDLHVLIEEYADDFDTYANLLPYGDDVHGLTVFPSDSIPVVFIAKEVADSPYRENRLRTTLAHEFGHVYLHNHLWGAKHFVDRLSGTDDVEYMVICKRSTILGAEPYDWMEWQAGYASGAILMPVSQVQQIVANYRETHDGLFCSAIHVASEHAEEIMRVVMNRFAVSEEAARIRLLKLRFLIESSMEVSFFEKIYRFAHLQ